MEGGREKQTVFRILVIIYLDVNESSRILGGFFFG